MDARDSKVPLRRSGFTLLEAALVTVIVGVGVVGVAQLLTAGTIANAESAEMTTAVNLAGNVAEMLQGKSYASLHASYDDITYSRAVDARGIAVAGLTNWSQTIDVRYVSTTEVSTTLPDTSVTDMSRVSVTVSHNGEPVYTTSWLAIDQ